MTRLWLRRLFGIAVLVLLSGAPLAEVAPSWRHSRTGQTVAQMLAALDRAALEGLTPLG